MNDDAYAAHNACGRGAALRVAGALEEFGRKEPRATATPAWSALVGQIATALSPAAPEAILQRADLMTLQDEFERWKVSGALINEFDWFQAGAKRGSGDDAKDAARRVLPALPQCTYLVDTEAKRHGMHPAYRSLQNVMKYGGESTFEQLFSADDMRDYARAALAIKGEST